MFLLQKFRPRLIKQMILVSIKKRFPNICWVSNSKKQNEHHSRNGFPIRYFGLFRKTCSDSIQCGMKTLRQVSLELPDLEKNLTSSFLALSDKLVLGVHVLLASVHTPHPVSLILQDSETTGPSSFLVQSDKLVLVLKSLSLSSKYSGEASILRNCSSSRSESGGVAMLSAES